MRPVITPEESGRLDSDATEPVEVLMERAGYGLAHAAARMGLGYGSRVIVLAGPGNNGGDAYVAARVLRRRGIAVSVRALGFPKGDFSPARKAACAAVHAGVPVRAMGAPEPADLVIDGLFGAGFHGELTGHPAAWAQAGGRVLAVDLPSGLSGADGLVVGPAFRAERTVTFHALKVGHLLGEGPDRCGPIDVVDIGIRGERAALRVCEDEDAPAPARERTSHKWRTGAVLVVGGSAGLEGAAVLAGRAALEAGAGYVRVACDSAAAPVVVAAEAALTTMPQELEAILGVADRFDAIAVGPGLGVGDEQRKLVAGLLERWDRALVVDADALTVTSVDDLAASGAHVVITPHAGEFSRLAGSEMSLDSVSDLAADLGKVVVAKGNPTLVVGDEAWVVTSGGPELASLGTGDVLTGAIAAFAARGLDIETAARSAAHRHGRAGAGLAASGTVTATRLADEIGRWSW